MVTIKFVAFFFYLIAGAKLYWSIPGDSGIGAIFLMVWMGFSLVILFMPVERRK